MLLAPSQMSCPLLKLSVIQTVMVASTEMRHPIWTGESRKAAWWKWYLSCIFFVWWKRRKGMKVWDRRMHVRSHKLGDIQGAPAWNLVSSALFAITLVNLLCCIGGERCRFLKDDYVNWDVNLLSVHDTHSGVWSCKITGRIWPFPLCVLLYHKCTECNCPPHSTSIVWTWWRSIFCYLNLWLLASYLVLALTLSFAHYHFEYWQWFFGTLLEKEST